MSCLWGAEGAAGWLASLAVRRDLLERCLAEEVAARFQVDLLKVEWHSASSPGAAQQIVVPSVRDAWFDHDELRAKATDRLGVAGATCADCGIWRWMPLAFGISPPLRITPALGEDIDIAASPEWFGDGWNAFRQILVRRKLAELIAAVSPRDFKIQPVPDLVSYRSRGPSAA